MICRYFSAYIILDSLIFRPYNSICKYLISIYTYYLEGMICLNHSISVNYTPHGRKEQFYTPGGLPDVESAIARCGIGYPELMVLYSLKTRTNLTQRQITEEVGLVKATVNTVIRDLKNRGLIILEPSRHDKREKYVYLTEKGKKYTEEIIKPLLEAEERISRKIGNDRMEQTIETMELFNLLFEKEWNCSICCLKKN